ncbi:hypothetical protein QBC37DRAFT_430530 [Rhypophila decipiens]|uniref:Uncharacterized protein n=1 Tax=Rhypophila decipiens TaxID=261697 RepID=A0AAN6XZ34_9PEZI|nr:hypothetical protein QBC37DRAFT_430530 [Rhypophila decipiens]
MIARLIQLKVPLSLSVLPFLPYITSIRGAQVSCICTVGRLCQSSGIDQTCVVLCHHYLVCAGQVRTAIDEIREARLVLLSG